MINTTDNDTVLAGLGELDLGLGYRVNNGFSINGGYRMLYASGVATSLGAIPGEYFTNTAAGKVSASDSLLLHGAYIVEASIGNRRGFNSRGVNDCDLPSIFCGWITIPCVFRLSPQAASSAARCSAQALWPLRSR